MHKSSIIGFFLLSSLIFGSANMMILQGAAAQDYYNDDKQYGDSSYSGYRDIITTTIIHQKIMITTKNMSVKMVHLKVFL